MLALYVKIPTMYIASTKDPQFFFCGFQILCGSRYSASPISTCQALISDYAAAVLVANCHKQTLEIENDSGVPFPEYVI